MSGERDACLECLRRAWLLEQLGPQLDRHRYDPTRLAAGLSLPDDQLLQALGGAQLQGLLRAHADFEVGQAPPRARVRRVCRHSACFPRSLASATDPPQLLHAVRGDRELEQLLGAPTVAIVGARAASDYGRLTARDMARGLAGAGVTVVSGLADGIAAAAHTGALEVGGPTVTVMPGGVDVCYPSTRRALHAQLQAAGGVISELPCGVPARRWCQAARVRIVVGLAQVLVVVEAKERPSELVHARMAEASGRVIAAVPGRVNAALSAGPNGLIAAGAPLVRSAQDVLDLLYGAGAPRAPRAGPALEPHLRTVFEQVSCGQDTVGRLAHRGRADEGLLVALAELELRGALTRGDGGRYLPSADFLTG